MTAIAIGSGRRAAVLALGSLVAATLAASCAPRDPAARVDQLRSRYSATASSFAVRQEPIAAPPSGAPAAPAAGQEPAPQVTEGPALVQTVLLDVMVRNESSEKLAGITVDVVLVDAQKQEKERRRVWVDTSAVEHGTSVQVTLELKDLPYEAGDGFFAEVRHPIPPEERSAYREFSG